MTHLVLHIGQAKTGTSAIQRHLSETPDLSSAPGTIYPKVGQQGGAHHPIAGLFLEESSRKPWIRQIDPDVLRKRLFHEIEKTGAETTILSSEVFFEVNNVESVAKFFQPFDVTIVILLRRQDLWLDSLFQHQCKVLEAASDSKDWLRQRVGKSATNYNEKVARWERVFGLHSVRLQTFESETMPQGLLSLFYSMCGLNAPDSTSNYVNEKVNRDSLELLRFLHFDAQISKDVLLKLRTHLERYSANNPDPRKWQNIFSPDVRRQILSVCSEGNQSICSRFFRGHREKLFLDTNIDTEFETYPGLNYESAARLLDTLANWEVDAEVLNIARNHYLR